MSKFEVYKFLHVSLAIIWVGGGIFGAVLTERAKRADHDHKLGITRDMEFAATRVFNPSAILLTIFGILMVIESDVFEFEQAWIIMGIGGVVASAILGMGFLGPQATKLASELEGHHPGADARLSRISQVALLDLAILVVVVWAMVAKPGFG